MSAGELSHFQIMQTEISLLKQTMS